jgi:hypothetical protein
VVERAYTDTSRAMNRRVEIEATTTLVRERQDTTQPGVAEPAKAAPKATDAH